VHGSHQASAQTTSPLAVNTRHLCGLGILGQKNITEFVGWVVGWPTGRRIGLSLIKFELRQRNSSNFTISIVNAFAYHVETDWQSRSLYVFLIE